MVGKMQRQQYIRIKQSKSELRNILKREHNDTQKPMDAERKQELIAYLASVGIGLRKKQV